MDSEILDAEFAQVVSDYRKFQEQFRDPVLVGSLLKRLSDEKESTNLILKEIHAKLDRILPLEERMARLEAVLAQSTHAVPSAKPESLLSSVDEELLRFVAELGKVCAEDVQARFQYKGRNGASSRLHRLYERGLLEKAQAGKKVFYRPRA